MTKRRGGFTLVEMAIVLVIVLVLAAILLPVFFKGEGGGPSPRSRCSSNLKQLGIAFMQYSQEYDERMPAVKFNNVSQSVSPYAKPFGWADALQLYMKSTYILQCLSEPQTDNGTDATQNGFTDYWYNTNLAKVKLEKIDSPAQTLMAGDGNDGTDATNARYTLNALPQSWRDTEKSPARRHLDTANYLFADGHVKSIKPKDIDNLPVAKSKSTFSVR